MPLPLTHALVPIAAMVAIARAPISGRLMAAAVGAAMAPDLDGLMHPLFGVAVNSIYGHRGFSHSLFIAIMVGVVAAALHRHLKVRPLTAAVVVTSAMASHGLLDMMTNSGRPVAYLWPLTSLRMFADWRPFPGSSPQSYSFIGAEIGRIGPEMVRVVIPLFVVAIAIRCCLWILAKVVPR